MADEDEELRPTEDQIRGFAQRVKGTISMLSFDKLCAGMTSQQFFNHSTEAGCLVIPQLANEIMLLEIDDEICLGVTKKNSIWMDGWPFDFIAATKKELFFVSKSYEWMQTKIPKIGVSTGPLPASKMLSRLCNQSQVYLYEVKEPRVMHSASLMRDGEPVKVFKSLDGVSVKATREHYEREGMNASDTAYSRTERHFLT